MPSTYLSLNYHIVFSTKDRQPSITQSWRLRLHEYLGGTADQNIWHHRLLIVNV
jgi:putative transposase